MKKELGIHLGNNYKVVQDEHVSRGFLKDYYRLNLEIEVSDKDMGNILEQIKSGPYYNQLGKFRREKRRYLVVGKEDMIFFKSVIDSIVKTRYKGSWFITDEGFEFIDLVQNEKSIYAEIMKRNAFSNL